MVHEEQLNDPYFVELPSAAAAAAPADKMHGDSIRISAENWIRLGFLY